MDSGAAKLSAVFNTSIPDLMIVEVQKGKRGFAMRFGMAWLMAELIDFEID